MDVTAGPAGVRAAVVALLDGPEGRALRAASPGDPRPLYRRLGGERLLAPHWPSEHGGRGLTAAEAAAVVEEMVRLGVPDTLHVLSVQIVGQFVLIAGTAAQRSTLLGPLARGERFATVLYTEPEAGSDIASVTTTATPAPAGGHRLRGTKVYNPWTSQADVALCLARTEPSRGRYRDLTLFLVPLSALGIEVRPLSSIGAERFHEVVLDGVEVGPEAVVGEVGGAWALMDAALALERTGVEYAARAERWLDLAVGAAVAAGLAGGAGWLEALGRLGAEAEAARLLAWQVVGRLREGDADGVAAAGSKWYTSRAAQRVAWWAAETGAAALDEALGAAHAEAPGLTLSAGTSEMMLQLVAGALAAGAEPE
ncbi:MAG TPA: acyl-CoA dehydrogenase family protein [Candidatus Eisenbacteria bacterium]|nr:acyl-CoA dehydrogenase family protein [Candidatus Eisenbacteria bacterium]